MILMKTSDETFTDLAQAVAAGKKADDAAIRSACVVSGRSRSDFEKLVALLTERRRLEALILPEKELGKLVQQKQAAGEELTKKRFILNVANHLQLLGELGRGLLFDADGLPIGSDYEVKLFQPALRRFDSLAGSIAEHEKAAEQLGGLDAEIAALGVL